MAGLYFKGLEIDQVVLKSYKSCFFQITFNFDCIKMIAIIQKLKLKYNCLDFSDNNIVNLYNLDSLYALKIIS